MCDPQWEQLIQQHPGHPVMREEAVYSLPPQLIDEIRKEAPDILTQRDEQFERDLANAAPFGGFFRQRHFEYPPLRLSSALPPNRNAAAIAEIKSVRVARMVGTGKPQAQIDQYFEHIAETKRKVDEWRWGFAGWLVTNSAFRLALKSFRNRLQENGNEVELPRIPPAFMGEHLLNKNDVNYPEQSLEFLRTWNLEGFVTWELPIPMLSETVNTTLYRPNDVRDAGVYLFIPYYLLRDKSLSLQEFAETRATAYFPSELADWYDLKPKNWGPARFKTMLLLYIYLECCLRRRYPDKVQGNLGKLDRALANYLKAEQSHEDKSGDETIRKIRLTMQKRLSEKKENPS